MAGHHADAFGTRRTALQPPAGKVIHPKYELQVMDGYIRCYTAVLKPAKNNDCFAQLVDAEPDNRVLPQPFSSGAGVAVWIG